jgi:hypothetical protein
MHAQARAFSDSHTSHHQPVRLVGRIINISPTGTQPVHGWGISTGAPKATGPRPRPREGSESGGCPERKGLVFPHLGIRHDNPRATPAGLAGRAWQPAAARDGPVDNPQGGASLHSLPTAAGTAQPSRGRVTFLLGGYPAHARTQPSDNRIEPGLHRSTRGSTTTGSTWNLELASIPPHKRTTRTPLSRPRHERPDGRLHDRGGPLVPPDAPRGHAARSPSLSWTPIDETTTRAPDGVWTVTPPRLPPSTAGASEAAPG